MNSSDPAMWRLLPGSTAAGAGAACAGGAYATILAGKKLLPQLLCLHDMLRRASSACPLVAVHDNRPHVALAPATLRMLRRLLGHGHVRSSSWLVAQANFTRGPGRRANFSRALAVQPRALDGRRLFGNSAAYLMGTMMIKLHLWALPFSRVCFLDLDVLVLRNLDSLLAMPLAQPLAAVRNPGCARLDSFNGGVLVFKPSRETLRGILLRSCTYYWRAKHARAETVAMYGPSCHAYRPEQGGKRVSGHLLSLSKMCEKRVADQSILNYHFRGNWLHLPYAYNALARGSWAPPVAVSQLAVLHFPGEPKPWSEKWAATTHFAAMREAGEMWQQACASRLLEASNGTAEG